MSSFSSSNSFGLCRLGSKRLSRKPLLRRKGSFRADPILVLTYFVFIGVLVSGFASFGL
ncbi:MAG: hypothetical protein OQL19_16020 [Gammaproteobacteria bacterium]|nr:hypothetical protein [Gammaproteobacteria bacterium]